MKLLSIHIDNFGKLRDFDLSLTDGVNTVFAENGYGKTTLAAFIKAMLYGLSRVGARVKDLNENERKHYIPWQGGAFGGYIDIETEKGRYRVSRSFGSKPAADTFTLIDLDTKLESTDYTENLGAELFGIDADSYEKSTYIPQRDVPVEMTANINTKLTRLLESSNDLDELDRAVKMLENHSKTFKAYKGSSGLIDEAQTKLDVTEGRIDACRASALKAERERNELEHIKQNIITSEADSKKLEKELDRINELTVKYNDFKILEQYKKEAEEAEKRLALRKSYFKNGIPNDDNISELEGLIKDITLAKAKMSYRKEASESQKKLEGYKKRFGDEPLTRKFLESVSEKIEALEQAENELRTTQIPTEPEPPKSTVSRKLLIPASCVFAAIGAVLCFVSLFVGIALIAMGAVALALGVATAANEKKANEIYQSKLEAYNAAKERQLELSGKISTLKAELDETFEKYYPDRLGSYDSAFTRLCADTESFSELIPEAQKETDRENEDKAELNAMLSSAKLVFSKYTAVYGDDLDSALKGIRENLRATEEAQNDLSARLRVAQKYAEEKGLSGDAPHLPDKTAVEQALSAKKAEQARLNATYGSKQKEIETLEAESDILPELIDEAERLRGDIAIYEEKRRTAESAKEFLKRASYNLSSKYLRKMEQSFRENYEKASDSSMPAPNIDAELGLTFRDGGAERGAEWYSEGIKSLIALCMRLALTDALFENESPFLILDDPFSELDGAKLERAKELIKELGNSRQIIYLTCHESRKIQ